MFIHPARNDAGFDYVDDWGGSVEEVLKGFDKLLDEYAEVFNEELDWSAEEVAEAAAEAARSSENYRKEQRKYLGPLLEEIGRIMSTPEQYVDEQYEDLEGLKRGLRDHVEQYSGRLGDLHKHLRQQERSIVMGEEHEDINTLYVANRDAEGDARYGTHEASPDGSREELSRRITLAETRRRLSSE
jgi:hypothetical protein